MAVNGVHHASPLRNPADVTDLPKETIDAIESKYERERDIRIRAEGQSQYIDIAKSGKFSHFFHDIWDDGHSDDGEPVLQDGSYCEFLVIGAGYGALTCVARLEEAGVPAEHIRMVDAAGGFGGSWYYNRYPGLMCDIESYVYMPLLEESGYMPKHKYSYGPELRQYANLLADKYGMTERTMFRTSVNEMHWDDEANEWRVRMTWSRKGHEDRSFTVSAHFVVLGAGTTNWIKLPKIKGLETFQGHSFHTARWDYAYTGGSELDQNLSNLADKRVGIVGTGATAIQAVPKLAQFAKEVVVFQRTASAVDARGQKETDPEWWDREIRSKKGWQKARRLNFDSFIENLDPPPEKDHVGDAWTKFPAYSALMGTPRAITPEMVPAYVKWLHQLDIPRQERIRRRTEEIVKDPATAESLKAWYPGWCKRPCFHDEYLQTFNLPHVKLVDTKGRGVDYITDDAVVANGEKYPLDLLIFSTGYLTPLIGSPDYRIHATISGRNGQPMADKWTKGVSTLHGITTRGFPNLFIQGPSQAGLTANIVWILEELSSHFAHIVSALGEKAAATAASNTNGQAKQKPTRHVYPFTFEPTAEAEAEWTDRVVNRTGAIAGMGGCTPSYFNAEGDIDRLVGQGGETARKVAVNSHWGGGWQEYLDILDRWRKAGDFEGLDIRMEA
ncbi:hypothetical protein AYO21_00629 [Fonsecaea monophora]|uniref:FAD/NAD(P)-binding domain-containing protein n=1 Tax=Fonsecaea monophora TaxID=254056 RepID=A0A177FNA4_9EURO|nr:hypothetical protein AYO21_00629 [Fonsecaea monophora]KAH0840717.1 Pentalenolactone D synthase [Fonsecaea pedrosoi]OAG45281.1 hypothetical protein AYO21_00629 [Fonsecaea monophora]